MVSRMGEGIKAFGGNASHVRCFAHIINLIARSILAQFDLPNKRTDMESDHEKLRKESWEGVNELADLDENGFKVEDEPNEATVNETLAGHDRILVDELRQL